MKKLLHIAIDGPVAAGKGTVAAEIAQRLDIVYVDTGAMYRAVALLGIQNNINLYDENKIARLLEKSKIEFKKVEHNHGTYDIFLNCRNVSKEIRTQEASEGSSIVATLPRVRKFLVEKQQEIAKNQSVVMEGRDITTKVLPNADLKIYLTADQEERARRRQKQQAEKGIKQKFKEVLQETKKRDARDTQRTADPLVIAPDAYVLDSTNLTVDQVVEEIVSRLNNK